MVSKGRDVQDKGQGEGIMYVDDRLGRRSGLDQLDVAEDLLAVVAAAVAVAWPDTLTLAKRSSSSSVTSPSALL